MTTYRLRMTGSLPGEVWNSGLHVTGPGSSTADALTAWAAAVTAFWTDVTDGVTAQFTAQVTIDVVDAAQLDPLTGKQIDRVEEAVTLAGTASGEMCPHECAVAVSTRTTSATRSGRGRMYLPPPAVSKLTDGRITNACATRILDGAVLMMNTLQGAGYTPVIWHPNLTSTDITRLDVGDVVDAQRRRRNKLIEARVSAGV